MVVLATEPSVVTFDTSVVISVALSSSDVDGKGSSGEKGKLTVSDGRPPSVWDGVKKIILSSPRKVFERKGSAEGVAWRR